MVTEFSYVFLIIFLFGKVFNFFLVQILNFADYYHRINHGMEIPAEIQGYVDKLKLEQTCAYEDSKYFLSIFHHIAEIVVSIVVVLNLYSYAHVYSWLWTQNAYLTNMLFMVIISVPGGIVDLIFDLIQEFKIEKNYGFSKMTGKMWFFDQLKSLLLTLLLAMPLTCAATALLIHVPKGWWAILALVYIVLSLLISYIFPTVVAPLFNKFTPLEDGDLKNRLEGLLAKNNFSSKGIYVMDASKRSGHSNAYFTGFGKNKRIVLYDTLLKQLTPEEIEAVLAHELGHYVKHHNLLRMAVTLPLVFLVLFILNLLLWCKALYQPFHLIPHDGLIEGVLESHIIPAGYEHFFATFRFVGITLIFSVFGGFMPLVNLVSNIFSRKNEFEADWYSAVSLNTAKPLCSALIKLNKENLSEFTPAKIYCIFNYSHPPLLERIKALKSFVPAKQSAEREAFYVSEEEMASSSKKKGLLQKAKDILFHKDKGHL